MTLSSCKSILNLVMAKKKKRKPRFVRHRELCIEGIAPGGWGVSGEGRQRVFVWGALPGDVVDVEVVRRLRGRNEAAVDRVVKRNWQTVEALCQHFDVCGGCLWQDLTYADQCKLKQGIVEFCFRDVGLDPNLIAPVLSNEQDYAYRNKMDFSFGGTETDTVLGMYVSDTKISGGRLATVKGQIPRMFGVEHCKLQSDAANQIVRLVRDRIQSLNLAPYDILTQTGVLRSLVIRESAQTGALLVHFLVAEDCQDSLRCVADELVEVLPQIAGVVLSVNSQRSKHAKPGAEVLLVGKGAIQESIADVIVNVSPQSFLQVNTPMAETLYGVALDFADLNGREKVWDLYCGTGSLSLLLAKHATKVIGIEVVDSAVADAEINSVQNQAENATFLCGDVLDLLPELVEGGERPDVITVNPPRAGVYRSVVKRICASKPHKIVYISCNPQTLARDLLRFEKGGYQTVAVQPVDMFPHTPHIEVVVKLEKCTNSDR